MLDASPFPHSILTAISSLLSTIIRHRYSARWRIKSRILLAANFGCSIVSFVMSDETQTENKSPRSPVYPLEQALEQVKRLHAQIGKSTVKPESAAVALRYKSINGAALTTLGTLSQYGLIERSRRMVAVTPLAIRILHPTGESQKRSALHEAALSPKIFKDIYENFGQCSVDVLTSHLVQSDFSPDRAKRVASVYSANKGFAGLGEFSSVNNDETPQERTVGQDNEGITTYKRVHLPAKPEEETDVLAQYLIPLEGNEATLTFKGESLTVSDLDALIEYIELFKKQLTRRENKTFAGFFGQQAKETQPKKAE